MSLSNVGTVEKLMKQIIGEQMLFAKIVVITEVDKDTLECVCHEIGDVGEIFENVRICADKSANFVAYPKIGSIAVINWLDEVTGYISQISEIEGYYIANDDNSFLDIMVDFITAIKNMTILTNQGASLNNGIINVADFQAVEDKLKNLFLK